jgi:hypothetical protein
MVASTRFRRMFASGGGFTLFMPALVKTYADSENHQGVREAIVYTVHRFFAQHNENFVFQSLDVIGHIMMVPGVDGDWLAQNVFSLFSSLKNDIPPSAPDAAGIRDSNKVEERDALAVSTAEEKPQAFLASLRQGGSNGKDSFAVTLPEEYEWRRLRLDDFVRLFLTVIAHDTTILRAELFLRLFRFLVPHLYHASASARSVLRDGIDALGSVLMKVTGKAKNPESTAVRPSGDPGLSFESPEGFMKNKLYDKSKAHSNLISMRSDYLSLIVAFTQSGGQMRAASSRQAIELVKVMLKDYSHSHPDVASFFADFTRSWLTRLDAPSIKDLITYFDDLTPVISIYAISVDFSGVFDTVSLLIHNTAFANEPLFAQRVVTRLCTAGLDACEMAASERHLFTLPFRSSLITLMTKAVFLKGADVIGEIEKYTPSYDFLAGVVFPFAVALEATTYDDLRGLLMGRDLLARAWIRLLAYAMSACRNGAPIDQPPRASERIRFSHRRAQSTSNVQTNASIIAMQIVKIVIIQADNDLSSAVPGIWSRIASFFESLLMDGNAKFALKRQGHSPPASPASPSGSNAGLGFTFTVADDPAFHGQTPFLKQKTLNPPRLVDYALWSLFELLFRTRNPLFIQLRLFIREKVAELDQALRAQQNTLAPTTPASRRVSSSSAFSKPRRRMSSMLFPETFIHNRSLQDLPLQTPGEATGPPFVHPRSFPIEGESSTPNIVHLGPIQSSARTGIGKSSTSGSAGGVTSKSLTVTSAFITRETHRRIRLVQSCLGYDFRLLSPQLDDERQDTDVVIWTKRDAIEAVIKETKELIDGFEDSYRADGVLADADLSIG